MHFQTGRSYTLGQQQAQHGHGLQSDHVARHNALRKTFLRVRRLQLGLVAAARVAAMSEAKAARDGRQRTSGLPYWRMVSNRTTF